MNLEERRAWLMTLMENQLRALASQYKIENAIVKDRKQLVAELELIEGVEVPQRA